MPFFNQCFVDETHWWAWPARSNIPASYVCNARGEWRGRAEFEESAEAAVRVHPLSLCEAAEIDRGSHFRSSCKVNQTNCWTHLSAYLCVALKLTHTIFSVHFLVGHRSGLFLTLVSERFAFTDYRYKEIRPILCRINFFFSFMILDSHQKHSVVLHPVIPLHILQAPPCF